ncbi:hypothetical protein RN001_014119 [Aquatica leii]|uniref:Uncharacterized protein n=1 Tax=Aquatica leii TaxID=1421715 RepID=A0AAN7PRE8_9COLE|nr:hypothetical protein RN001_014119 [Aquatica leii]
MTPKLYCLDASPPVRSVYLAAAALNVKLECIQVNLMAQEHLTPEFLKMNPQHTVPTLVDDDGTCVWDSHAINAYLTMKYGKDDSLYPKDLIKRAIIDQRLHFDSGLAFLGVRNIAEPIIFFGSKTIPNDLIEKSIKIYEFLETFLSDNLWMAGENLTIADFSLIPSITSLNYLVPIEDEKFPKLLGWIKRAEELPYYHLNQKGLDDFKNLIDANLTR